MYDGCTEKHTHQISVEIIVNEQVYLLRGVEVSSASGIHLHQQEQLMKHAYIRTTVALTCACAAVLVLGVCSFECVDLAGGGGWSDPIPYCLTWGCDS